MANKCVTLMMFSWFFVGLCQGRGGGGGGDQTLCMEELLPCKAYFHRSSTPAPSCCVPLIKFVSTGAKCLCDVFTNSASTISFNATQEDAFHLAKGCGAIVDESFCNAASTTTVSPSQLNVSSHSLRNNFTAGAAQSKSIFTKKKKKEKKKKKGKKKSAANTISKFRGSSVLVVLYGVFLAMNV